MPDRQRPIARIRLARSLPRLLAGPLIVALAGGVTAAAGAASGGGGPASLALVGLGIAVTIAALLAAVLLLSVGFEVAESAISMTWLGGHRDYPLAPGPVTRVRLRGPAASKLRARFGALGWGIGRARLRGEEEIQLIRLASTATAILIPTERGRLAVAPANEDELLEALAGAAQARQRAEAEVVAAQAAAEAAPAAEVPSPPEPADEAETPPASLTGIERALLEERLARERAESLAAAEAARVQAEARGSGEPAEADAPPPETDALPPEPVARRRPSLGSLMPRPSWGFVLLPTAGAGIAWWAGGLLGRPPEPGSDLARIVSLALVLAGPATSVGAIMALAWWPRLVGVVVTGGLVAVVFIGRALIGAN